MQPIFSTYFCPPGKGHSSCQVTAPAAGRHRNHLAAVLSPREETKIISDQYLITYDYASFVIHVIKGSKYQELDKGSKLCRITVGSDQLEEHSVPIRASHQQLTHLYVNLLTKTFNFY